MKTTDSQLQQFQVMLTNIANDLDLLLNDLSHIYPYPQGERSEEAEGASGENGCPPSMTLHSGDTLGNDSFFSSTGATSRHHGNMTGSSPSLLTSSGSDNLSIDSGHDDLITRDSQSPLAFDPNHFGSRSRTVDTTTTSTMTPPMPTTISSQDGDSHVGPSGGELRPISTVERLSKTHSIWLLTQMSRAGAVHLLKDRETGVFIVRKSSQALSLALSVQNVLNDRANVDHYLIEATDYGMRLQGSVHFFHSIPALIAHYMENLDELPYRLTLPVAILQARSSRELSSLAMLGQDFWLSPVSRKSPTPQLVTGPLHKSCSEPISIIRTQHEGRAATPIAAVPAHSAADLSKFSSSHHLQQEHKQVFTEHFHAQMNAGHRPSEAGCKISAFSGEFHDSSDKQSKTRQFGPHLLRLRELNVTTPSLDSSWEESNIAVPHIELVPAAPQSMSDASSQTDFLSLSGHRPKGKPNLYSMTPVELLNIPEPSYFRSSLSDKMSDYEDIWRSSCYDTDSVRNGSVRGHVYDEGSTVTAVSDFSKMIVFKRPKRLIHQQIDGMSALTDKSRQLEIVSLVPSQAHVKCPPHMDRLTRLKSSSESSLATLASPIYAEPADAIVLRDKRLRASKLKSRRRSAPSSAGQFGDTENNSKGVHVSKEPSLATILSPDAVKTQDSDSDKFDFELKPSHAAVRKLNTGISRSNSVRTPQEMARLAQKKPAWQERFKRLKLGTKVLTSQQSPYSASCQNSYHPQQMSFDDNLFVLEEDTLLDSGPSFRPSLGKFPVYQQRQGHNKGVNRASYFSESSTMQDIISCAMPELLVRPIQTQIKIQGSKPYLSMITLTLMLHPPPVAVAPFSVSPGKQELWAVHDHHSRTQQSQSALGSGGHHVDDEGSNSKSEVSTPMAELDTNTCESDHHSKVKMSQSQPGLPLLHQELHLTRHHLQPSQQHAQPLTRSVSQPAHNTCTVSNLHQQQSLTVSHHQLTCPHNSQDSRHQQPPHVGHSPPNKTIDLPAKCVSSNHGKQNIHLSSTCPDVINCHHVKSQKARTVGQKDAMNNSLYPADEVLVDNLPYLDASLRQQIQPLASSPCGKMTSYPGGKIHDYILRLSQDKNTTFGVTVENFIQCTVDSQDRNPYHVMRNVRQFMTGIKNYLVKHGEGELEDKIEQERAKLGTNEILSIDAIIETTLHMCVLRPLKHHIYRLLVDYHGRNNSLELMSRNIKYARTKTAEEIGIKPELIPPQGSDMETIKHHLDKMQRAYSPIKKLENLLSATSAIYASVKGKQQAPCRGPASLGADDFLPLLIYVLVHCGLVSAEIEADYMWGLLQPSVLTGEGGYYLTTLSSAVLILKNFQEAHENKTASLEGHLPTIGEVQGFLKIGFPDELRDTIIWKTLPVRPNMTTKDVCAMIAHKFKITNPQDYGLILLCDGEETQLMDSQCPQILKKDTLAKGKECFFTYKRLGANIAWPSSMKHS
ncbi:LOW QUALITY PROTEIN: uncharacterized protein LOC112570384 [Pomacea canaliculata]|uniref:LOW QUALITY PROTEIN: uncharacterized protein LOC112570384 n=1 Tax=Pomacea canaliculata TaxID=400727 RepID=UPI000D7277A2|nr:LOW QUALITY PROTEIN: uncharacterized protein LOC112570384 [Pomacea canaliculata]